MMMRILTYHSNFMNTISGENPRKRKNMLMKREIKERGKGKKGAWGEGQRGSAIMEEGKFMVLASEK